MDVCASSIQKLPRDMDEQCTRERMRSSMRTALGSSLSSRKSCEGEEAQYKENKVLLLLLLRNNKKFIEAIVFLSRDGRMSQAPQGHQRRAAPRRAASRHQNCRRKRPSSCAQSLRCHWLPVPQSASQDRFATRSLSLETHVGICFSPFLAFCCWTIGRNRRLVAKVRAELDGPMLSDCCRKFGTAFRFLATTG